jgi:MFS family permease
MEAATGIRATLRSLAHRNYRLYFFGQGVSLIGAWMQQVAMTWLIYDLRHSAFLLGAAGFASQVPSFVIAPLAGVFSDRWDRRRTLLVTQSLALVQAALLTVMAWTGWVEVWSILAICLWLGAVNAFDIPARQAFLNDLIEHPGDLANAIALNSSLFNGARLIGPALAGFVIAAAGEKVCFLINAVSYLAVLAALLAMSVPQRHAMHVRPGVLQGLKEGLVYTFGFPPVRSILMLVGVVSFTTMPLSVLMPIVADKVMGGGAQTLGYLTSAQGLGALSGALYLASRRTVLGLGKRIALGATCVGLGMTAFSWMTNFWLSCIVLALIGCAMMVQMAASNTIVQTIVDSDKRGRVMSLYATAFMGMAPLGSLAAGALAARIGAEPTLRLCGACSLFGGLLFASQLPRLRVLIRPIYIRAGILPEIAGGVEAASELTSPRRG